MSNFLTVSGLKAFRPSGSTAALDFTGWTDDQLQTILDEVEEIFESGTGNKFHSFSETVYVSGVHQAFLFLPQHGSYRYPIVSITSVEEVDLAGTVLTTYVEDTDFIAHGHYLYTDVAFPDTIRASVSKNSYWPRGHRNIKIVGTFGMSSTPAVILRAGYTLAVINTLGLSKSGLLKSSDLVKEQEKWEDYEVKYQSEASAVRSDMKTPNITGYVEIDRILGRYVNYSDLFMSTDNSVHLSRMSEYDNLRAQ